jgi:hypothetical protein
MRKTLVANIISHIYMILFVYAGLSKMIDYHSFKDQLSHVPVLGYFKEVSAVLFPIVEVALGCLIYFEKYRLTGLCLAIAMMGVFTAYVLYLILFEKNAPCSCGGLLAELSWKQHFFFNVTIIVLGAIAIRIEIQKKKYWQDVKIAQS